MRKIYLSFLGIGSRQKDGTYRYDAARYSFDGTVSMETEFVQVAEIQLLGPAQFDEIIVVATVKSCELHYSNLEAQLKKLGVERITPVIIHEEMSAEAQWSWFEKILERIRPMDCLTVDLTHGYRAVPIIFSTAVNFLQKAKGIKLDGVYYGAYEKNRDLSPIIDMKDFYRIGEWAEAVSRLVEDADARKIAEMGREAPPFQAKALSSKDLVSACENLTNTLRNVDIQNVSEAASAALKQIESSRPNASPMENILLGMIVGKFSALGPDSAHSGRYDSAYFKIQQEIARLLVEHKLYMQAFTVMREMIASIGLIRNEKARSNRGDRKNFRRRADIFLRMLQFDETQWNFEKDDRRIADGLLSLYEELKSLELVAFIRSFLPDLLDCRNGFDHAWTAHKKPLPDFDAKGREFLGNFQQVFQRLETSGILHQG